MDYIKQIWLDQGRREHVNYVFGDVIMEIIKDKMPKRRGKAVCLTWMLRQKCKSNMLFF